MFNDIQGMFDKISINGFQKIVIGVFVIAGLWLLLQDKIHVWKGGKLEDLYKPIDSDLKKADEAVEGLDDDIDNLDI